eukprot:7821492-Alexandrium_andersonii.AAC.1
MWKEKFLSRLKAFWTNVLLLRFLWEALHGDAPLPWVNCDQKPLWFTSASSEKTLAPKGSAKVRAKEN